MSLFASKLAESAIFPTSPDLICKSVNWCACKCSKHFPRKWTPACGKPLQNTQLFEKLRLKIKRTIRVSLLHNIVRSLHSTAVSVCPASLYFRIYCQICFCCLFSCWFYEIYFAFWVPKILLNIFIFSFQLWPVFFFVNKSSHSKSYIFLRIVL